MNDHTDNHSRLTAILAGAAGGNLHDLWNKTGVAEDFKPVPKGTYECRVVSGELETSQGGTQGYKLTFAILDGEHAGRRLWHDLWLTELAMPFSKRELRKLGIDSPDKLEQPLAKGIRCKVNVVVHKGDDGSERNRVKGFEVLGIDPPEADPFAPVDKADPDEIPF